GDWQYEIRWAMNEARYRACPTVLASFAQQAGSRLCSVQAALAPVGGWRVAPSSVTWTCTTRSAGRSRRWMPPRETPWRRGRPRRRAWRRSPGVGDTTAQVKQALGFRLQADALPELPSPCLSLQLWVVARHACYGPVHESIVGANNAADRIQ